MPGQKRWRLRMIVDELITLLGFETAPGSEQEAKKFGASVDAVKNFAVGAGLALAGATAAIGAWAVSLAASVDAGGKFADSIGESYEDLQEFEFAAQRAGGSAEALRGDLRKLTDDMSSPIPGEFNQELMLLGINTRNASGEMKTATEVLTDLAGKFEGMSAQRASQFGARLGLSEDTIMLLQQGADGIAQLRAEARDLGGILPNDARIVAAEFNDQLTNIQFSLSGIARQAGVAVLPALTEVVQAANAFIAANRQIIQSGLEAFVNGTVQGFRQFGDLVGSIAGAIGDLLGPMGGLLGNLDATDAIATAVTAALAGIVAVVTVLSVKFITVGLAIAAVVVALQDLIMYFQGGDSAVGRFLDNLEQRFPAVFGAVREFLTSMGGIFSDWAEGAGESISSVIGFFQSFADKFPSITGAISDALGVLGGFWAATFGAMADAVILITSVIGKLVGAVTGFVGSGIMSVLEGIEGVLGGSASPSLGYSQAVPASVSNSMSSTSSTQSTQININGSGDPRAVAAEVVRRGNLQNISQQIAPGINAAVIE